MATGKVQWESTVAEGKPRYGTHNSDTFASETPASDGERIYAYFGANGTVAAYDLAGKQVWKMDVGAYRMQSGWSCTSSPEAVMLHDNIPLSHETVSQPCENTSRAVCSSDVQTKGGTCKTQTLSSLARL